MPPFAAAVRGAREMGFTIVSISVSLVAVLIPIFYMPGVIGLMFHEYAVVVGLSILVSALVSLTLVPMLCSRHLRHEAPHPEGRLGQAFERGFAALQAAYARSLDWALEHRLTMGSRPRSSRRCRCRCRCWGRWRCCTPAATAWTTSR